MHSNPTTELRRPVPGPAATFDPTRLAGATVLAVWAHPDDESYLGGGLMAAAAAAGGRVVNVTATLGEHGTPDPIAMPPARLASIRRGELSGALGALGVTESIVLGYEDGTLDQVDPYLGARRIASLLDDLEPDVVLSFGPDGVTGHPDHITIGAWTEDAIASGWRRPALLQTAVRHAMPADLVDAMCDLGAFFPGAPVPPVAELADTFELVGVDVDTKLKALAAHGSQTEGLKEALGEIDYRRLAAVEAYRPANPAAWDLLTGVATATVA